MKIDPIQTFRNATNRARLIELVAGAKEPLPTTFRVTHSFSMSVELSDLLKAMRCQHGINVSREIEPVIKRWAIRRAREINAVGRQRGRTELSHGIAK